MARRRLGAAGEDHQALAVPPKSFFEQRHRLDTEHQWVTYYDDTPMMRFEADLIYHATGRGLSWSEIYEMELWQLAGALGVHRVETRAERDEREIVEAKKEEWAETESQRMERLSGYSARRRAREQERARERRQQKAS